MMYLTTLPLSFWDYALESATRILNMVPTKKVDKTPYELWYGKVPNLSNLKVWGCEALVKYAEFFEKNLITQEVSGRAIDLKEIQDEDTSPSEITSKITIEVEGFETPQEEVILIRRVCNTYSQYGSYQEGYHKETMGYYFYFSLENKIVIARYAEFFEKNLITQEVSGRAIDLKEIQDEDTSPSEITSKITIEVEGFETPQEEVILIRRSERTHQAPNHLGLNVEVEEHSLRDLNEPASYKSAMLDLESNKTKWIFKKKTDMDGIVQTYKARLVSKSYTQLYRVDYEETFSPITNIRAIRILISITAFYDYKIWKMDVKTALLNGYLDEDIYMDYLGKCFAMKDLREAAFILGIKIYRDRYVLVYGGNPKAELRVDCYYDARFETDRDDTKSQTGYVFILNGDTVDWKSFKQSTTVMSATDSEYIAASKAAIEVVWIRKFISGLGIVPTIN
nr:hypothetical protein [Tanacetum cinerariifolium]